MYHSEQTTFELRHALEQGVQHRGVFVADDGGDGGGDFYDFESLVNP